LICELFNTVVVCLRVTVQYQRNDVDNTLVIDSRREWLWSQS